MNKLMDWMKGKFMKYHISDKEYDMIQADMQEENRNRDHPKFCVNLRCGVE